LRFDYANIELSNVHALGKIQNRADYYKNACGTYEKNENKRK
jgi:hypothetical protein